MKKSLLSSLLFACTAFYAQQTSTGRILQINTYTGDPTGQSCSGNAVVQSSAWGVCACVNRTYQCGGGAAGITGVSVKQFGAKCDWNGTTGTDDTAAFNAAWASIASKGGEIDLPLGSCYVPNGLNLSSNVENTGYTLTIRGRGKLASFIITKNANIGLDFGGVDNVHLESFTLQDVGTTPNVGIARYRIHLAGGDGGDGGGGSAHTYRNFGIIGYYQKAALYSVASEVNDHYSMDIREYGDGAGLVIASTNCLGLTGTGRAIATSSSDTLNRFFGGMIVANRAGQRGGAVLFCNGDADDVSFDHTYFVGEFSGYNVRFGQSATDWVQGSKAFHSVRFEGTANAISIDAKQVDSVSIDSGSTFGELSPGIDINYINLPPMNGAAGMNHWDVHGNSHHGNGIHISAMTSSNFNVGSWNQSPEMPATVITIASQGFISESTVRADRFSFAANTTVAGSVLTQSDNVTGTGSLRVLFGPNNPTDAYGSGGSVVAFRPFGTAPAKPVNGEVATADGSNWKPFGVTFPTIMQYINSAWVPISSTGFHVSQAQAAIASSTTISPTAPFFHVTGTTAIATITAPAICTNTAYSCKITIIPDGAFTTTTSGNIALASTAVVSKALIMTYDPSTLKWYPSY